MPIWLTDQCFNCKRWRQGSDPIACDAFDGEIPVEILTGEFDHTRPYPGDRGMRYDPLPPQPRNPEWGR